MAEKQKLIDSILNSTFRILGCVAEGICQGCSTLPNDGE